MARAHVFSEEEVRMKSHVAFSGAGLAHHKEWFSLLSSKEENVSSPPFLIILKYALLLKIDGLLIHQSNMLAKIAFCSAFVKKINFGDF